MANKKTNSTNIFHSAAGTGNEGMYHPQTPFQMIGSGLKSAAKSVGKVIDKNFIEPSRNVDRIQDTKMKAMDKKAKSGQYN